MLHIVPFAYFGSKRRLAPTYPRPIHDTIIEPFAGAAAYSLHADNWMRNVILVDKNPEVVELWRWIQTTTPEYLASLPNVSRGDTFPFERGTPEQRLLSWCASSTVGAVNVVSGYQAQRWNAVRGRVGRFIDKIQHWQIIEGDYTDAPDIEATWFVDPPYQHFGSSYGANAIDFHHLGEWCLSRRGQVIVCEQEPADWLPFQHHRTHVTQTGTRNVSELIWTNTPDLSLF